MDNSGWIVYNHALIPDCAPHEQPRLEALDEPTLWKTGRPLLARWTCEFDSAAETSWWYCICDRPFDLQSLKSKRRNVVQNALKYCEVRRCEPGDYEQQLLEVYRQAQRSYDAVNRQSVDPASFHRQLERISRDPASSFYLCFLRDGGALAGYAIVRDYGSYCAYQVQKVAPELERFQPNAALVYAVLKEYESRLQSGYYLCDGARNINHATNFQAYLEKYFGFRKAYCRLQIRYRRGLKPIVSLLYPARKLLGRMDGCRPVHLLNGVLRMEEIRRQTNE